MLPEEHIDFFYKFNPTIYLRENKEEIFIDANKIIASAMGLSPSSIKVLYDKDEVEKYMRPNARGSYNVSNNTIYLNLWKYSNPYIILSTIAHETMHIFLHTIMQRGFCKQNVENITFEQYAFATAKVENIGSFFNFREFLKFCNIDRKYLNMLRLDKLYSERCKEQPYYYNVDSSEVFAEYLSYILLYDIMQSTNRTKEDVKQLANAIDFLDYSYNGNTSLKRIYVEENATDKSLRMVFEKLKLKSVYDYNPFDINEYDIDGYIEVWNRMVELYKKIENKIKKEKEIFNCE